jgi:hypothetical protein
VRRKGSLSSTPSPSTTSLFLPFTSLSPPLPSPHGRQRRSAVTLSLPNSYAFESASFQPVGWAVLPSIAPQATAALPCAGFWSKLEQWPPWASNLVTLEARGVWTGSGVIWSCHRLCSSCRLMTQVGVALAVRLVSD